MHNLLRRWQLQHGKGKLVDWFPKKSHAATNRPGEYHKYETAKPVTTSKKLKMAYMQEKFNKRLAEQKAVVKGPQPETATSTTFSIPLQRAAGHYFMGKDGNLAWTKRGP